MTPLTEHERGAIACPDCGQPWNIEREPVCAGCGLTTSALEDAADFLAQIDAERDHERGTVEL